MHQKVKARLAEQLRTASRSDLVDVVLEVLPEPEPAGGPAALGGGRAAQIAAKKAAFDRAAAGLDEAVREAGGEVTGRAWINHTVRARLPAAGVADLCRDERVAALDAPGRLTAE